MGAGGVGLADSEVVEADVGEGIFVEEVASVEDVGGSFHGFIEFPVVEFLEEVPLGK